MFNTVSDLSSPEDLRQASNRIYIQIIAVYLLIVTAISVVAVLPANADQFLAVSLPAWALIGWCQFALFNALHEGLHLRLGSPHRESPGFALTAWPLGFPASYRQLHLDHHRYFGDPIRDPDYASYTSFPHNRRAFRTRLLMNLCGFAALKQFLAMMPGAPGRQREAGDFAPVLLTQCLICGCFGVTVGWVYYCWLWLLPLVSFAKFFSSTRTFCEHANPGDRAVVRTITGSFPGEKVFGVFNFHYHAEHHRYVGIPCDRLPAAHTRFGENLYRNEDTSTEHYEHYTHGYFNLLRDWYRALPH